MKIIGKEYKVKLTEDYSKFSTLPMNRDIDSKHVQKIITSLRKQGCIRAVICCRTNIIEGIEKLYIIDSLLAKLTLGGLLAYSVVGADQGVYSEFAC